MSNEISPEPQYDCPVCPGLPMQKLQITHKSKGVLLTLDGCKRCGGVWFDKGEVQLSRQITSPKVRQRITHHTSHGQSYCQNCHIPMDRNLAECVACGWKNQIACPICAKALQRKQHKHLTLDICHSCNGIWFDQEELSAIWSDISNSKPASSQANSPRLSSALSSAQTRHSDVHQIAKTVGRTTVENGLDVVTQGLLAEADLAQCLVHTAGNAAKGSANAIASTPNIAESVVESLAETAGSTLNNVGDLPEVTTVMLEVTGEVAGCVVERLIEVLSSLSQ